MPRVPTYDNLTSSVSNAPTPTFTGGGFRAPEGPTAASITAQQLGDSGRAQLSAGEGISRIANEQALQANQVLVDSGTNQAIEARSKLMTEAMSLTGRNALERPDGQSLVSEYGDKYKKATDDIAATLRNPAQQQAFTHQAAMIGHHMTLMLGNHVVQAQKDFAKQTDVDTVKVAVNQGSTLYADPVILQQSKDAIEAVVQRTIKREGLDPVKDKAIIDTTRNEAMSPLHAGVITNMLSAGQSTAAKDYYDANSAQMSMQQRMTLHEHIQSVDVQVQGENAADSVWDKLGPKSANEPVKLFDMEAAARDQFKGDPKKRDAAITSLKQRAASFNAQQSETNAGSTNAVFKMIDSGTPMAKVQSSPDWLALPDVKRHEVLKSLESEAATRAARAASEASRAYSASGRELNTMIRDEKMNFMRNGAMFNTMTDPDVLSKMTRAQVEATRTEFGQEPTAHLLNKWDTLKHGDQKVIEARFDQDDFNQSASQLGLKPFDKASPAQKEALGTLKYRVEQLIDVAQTKEKRQLTRTEKGDIMRKEMATQVSVKGWFSDTPTPVIQLTPDQAAHVRVPAADETQIKAALAAKYQQNPGNPMYAPTPENIRKLYLKHQSQAGGLIPDAK
jgi:hypothetical protein